MSEMVVITTGSQRKNPVLQRQEVTQARSSSKNARWVTQPRPFQISRQIKAKHWDCIRCRIALRFSQYGIAQPLSSRMPESWLVNETPFCLQEPTLRFSRWCHHSHVNLCLVSSPLPDRHEPDTRRWRHALNRGGLIERRISTVFCCCVSGSADNSVPSDSPYSVPSSPITSTWLMAFASVCCCHRIQ